MPTKFWKIYKNAFFTEHLRATASVHLKMFEWVLHTPLLLLNKDRTDVPNFMYQLHVSHLCCFEEVYEISVLNTVFVLEIAKRNLVIHLHELDVVLYLCNSCIEYLNNKSLEAYLLLCQTSMKKVFSVKQLTDKSPFIDV